MFYEKPKGKESIIRQLSPLLHVEGQVETLANIARFLPKVLQVGASKPADKHAREHGDWKVVASMDELARELQRASS